MPAPTHFFDCPKCGAQATGGVVDTRPREFAGHFAVMRRRACNCGHRFSTFEVPQSVVDDAIRDAKKRLIVRLIEETI